MNKKLRKWISYFLLISLFSGLFLFVNNLQVHAATLLTDDFTGTTIDTAKWTEIDTGGAGGTTGNITQNGVLSTAQGFAGSVWGTNAITSTDTFDSDSLEISAVMTNNSDQLLGYGDYNFQSAGTKAFIIDALASNSVLALTWNNGSLTGNTSCGAFSDGATYRMKLITSGTGGFEVYKDDVLQCTHTTGLTIDNTKVFLQSSATASTFDNVLVTGNSAAPTAPGQVTSLSATAGDAQVSLTWSAPGSNGGSAITDYLIEYKLNSEPTTWSIFSDGTSTSTSATVTGLSNGSLYNFRVSAINAVGTGTASSTANATPSAPTAPAAPTIGTAVAGDSSASVSFTPGSNGGSAITGYTATSSPGGFTGTGSSSPITVSGLTNGVSYTFTVTATNAVGTSSASSASNSVTPNAEVPTSIANLSLWLDGGDAANMTESSGLISQINDKSGNGKNGIASGSTRPTLVSGELNGRSVIRFDGTDDYFNINSSVTYRTVLVVAKKSTSSAFSNYPGIIGDFTGTSPSNGHVLNGVDATTKLATATSNFASAYKNGDSIAGSSGHDFSPLNQFWIGTFTLSSNMTNTTSSIGMINGGGRYWNGDIAEVIAYSTTLTTDQRQTLENYLSTKWGIAVSGPTVPGAPTSLAASRGNTQVGLSWTAPSSDGGNSITDYIVEYKLTSEPATWTIFSDGTSTSTSTTVTSLTNGLSYDFRVKAVNGIGTGTASNTATKTPGPPIAPEPPTSVTAVEGNSQATVSFTAPADNGGASITSYTATSSPGGFTASGASSPLTVTGLTNGVSYTFTVTATNSAGTSSASSASNSVTPSTYGSQMTDNFTGTTINTTKWYEKDATGSGGTSGKVQQNGSLTIADSYSGGVWGSTALVSQDVYDSTNLEISASMTPASSPLIGYGDYDFGTSGKKAYLVYEESASSILALSWTDTSYTSTSCGSGSAGAATYKMKIISGGFEVYKNGVLSCTHYTAVVVNNARVFLQNSTTASTFDDVLVYGLAPTHAVPDAPTIGTATAGNASAIVTFTAPNFNNGSAITGYTVTSSPGGITASGSSSPITVTGLTNDVTYTFTVTATNGVGTSSASSASNSATPTLPAAPGQVTGLVATGFNQQVLLGWDAPSSGGTPTDYIIEYKLSSEPTTWTTFNDGTSTAKKAIVTGLTNASAYDFRVKGSNDGNPGTVSDIVSATPDAISSLAFVITGESNSGGIGLNSDATVGELASRSAVQIMNLTSGQFLFENLDIGTNNLRDHAGLEGYYDCCHGFELQLANSTEANAFPDNPQVYLVKTGHGGSQVTQWGVGQTYWTKFLQRTAAAKTQLPAGRKWVVFLSLGINDAIAGNNVNTWKTNMAEWMDRIKADLPGAIIIMTGFQSMGYGTYNTAITELAASEPNVYAIDSTGAGLRDANHWSYSGLKTVTSSMVTTAKSVLGLNFPGLPTSLSATPSSSSVALTWTAPAANGGAAISDYVIQYKTNAASTWSTFSDGTSTATSTTVTGLTGGTVYNFRVKAINANGGGNYTAVNSTTTDDSPPTITDISSNKSSGTYGEGEVIDIDVTFSEAVTSTGNVTVTLETGIVDRTCTFVITNSTTGTCNYTVQGGDTSGDLTVSSISGTIADQNGNAMISFSPATNLAANKALVIDTTGSEISLVTATPSSISATVTWATDELSSSIVQYGLTNSYGTSTTEADTSPRVTSHSVSLSNLVACTLYHYRVKSNDVANNLSTGSDNTFTTTGCTGSASVINSTTTSITANTGGSVQLNTGADDIVLDIPANATNTNVIYQVKQLDEDEATSTTGLPSGYLLADAHVYNFTAYSDSSTTVTSFDEPIEITISYEDSDVVGMNESTLVIYHYTGGNWTSLAPCIVNTSANTVTCSTTSFSIFGLMGTASASGGSSGSLSKHSVGINIVTPDGTIYTLTADGKRRPYTSAGAFLSYGFNSFATTVKAWAGDLKIPLGYFIPPRDGSITCSDRGVDEGTCYLITDGKKAGFTSAAVFKALGFNFLNVQYGDVSFMESAPNISTAQQAHHIGTLINNEGTLQIIGSNALIGIPSMYVLTSWGYNPATAVLANTYDKLLIQQQVLTNRNPGVIGF